MKCKSSVTEMSRGPEVDDMSTRVHSDDTSGMDKPSLCIAERFPSLEMSSGSDDGILLFGDAPFRVEQSGCQTNQHTGSLSCCDRIRCPTVKDHDRDSPESTGSLLQSVSSEYYDFVPSPNEKISMTYSTDRRTKPERQSNHVLLHIYDLIATDTLMLLPWGCVCEIGKCFNEVNSALHELGTGAYHVGVEVNGIEYAYGACSQPYKSGVFSCIPKLSPGYQYRTSIDFGEIQLMRSSWVTNKPPNDQDGLDSPRSITSTTFKEVTQIVNGRTIMKEMASEYMGVSYDILRRNCCTFAADACVRLGVPQEEIPSWFRNLAETGAYSQDVANAAFVEPLQKVLSTAAHDDTICGAEYESLTNNANSAVNHNDDEETGFELITKRNASNTRDVVVVIDADPNPHQRQFRPAGRAVTLAY